MPDLNVFEWVWGSTDLNAHDISHVRQILTVRTCIAELCKARAVVLSLLVHADRCTRLAAYHLSANIDVPT